MHGDPRDWRSHLKQRSFRGSHSGNVRGAHCRAARDRGVGEVRTFQKLLERLVQRRSCHGNAADPHVQG
jgi:hypothetical protein